jgi:predicted dehydrogenase
MTKKVNVGILGAGQHNIATDQQMPACLNSEVVDLTALCDRLETVHSFAKQAGVKAYTNYVEMLKDDEIEMIQVATPDQFHCEHAIMALKAGKHVLLQKPPCLNMEELDKLREAAVNSKGCLKVILNQRQHVLSRSIKNYIQQGAIGELREIIIKYRGRRFPIENLESFYLKKESGGVWLHNSLHWLDEACFYSESMPQTINVFSTKNENGAPQCLGEGPNYWSAVFPMDKVTFLFEYNTMLLKDGMPGGMQRVLIGTEGEIRQEYGSNDLTLYHKDSDETRILPLLADEPEGLAASIKSFTLGIDEFAREILDGKERNPKINETFELFELLIAGLK